MCQEDSLQIITLHPLYHLINVGRGRRGQGVLDLKAEVERLCEEGEAESTHWDEGLWVVLVENQGLANDNQRQTGPLTMLRISQHTRGEVFE